MGTLVFSARKTDRADHPPSWFAPNPRLISLRIEDQEAGKSILVGSRREMMQDTMNSFRIAVSDDVVADLRHRLANIRWTTHRDGLGWTAGTDPGYLRQLVDYWQTSYDWRQHEAPGLNDSAVGLAAWMVEKFQSWSDCDGDIESRFSKDELLTHIMVYWVTESIGTSFLPYFEYTNANALTWMKESIKNWMGRCKVPTAFALFPKDISSPPREWAARFFDVQRWTKMPRGGHFAAMEEPQLLAEDLRAWFRKFRAT